MNETINIWCGEADLYDASRPQPPIILLDLCTQLAQVERPQLVVDLGSGTGFSTLLWIERAEQVIGIEPNADMRRLAEVRTSTLSNKASRWFVHADGSPPELC